MSYILRLGLGGLFLWAGVAKLLAPRDFAVLISHYRLVPTFLLPAVAVGLPAVEALVGLGMLFGKRKAYFGALSLVLLFLAVLWFGILQGLEIDCGCFSAVEQAEHGSLRTAFLRDWFLLVPLLYLLASSRGKGSS